MGSRAHFLDDLIDAQGNALTGATVNVYQQGTSTPVTGPIYAADDPDGATLSNPLTSSATGTVEFYLAAEDRVDLVISKSGYTTRRITVEALVDNAPPTFGSAGYPVDTDFSAEADGVATTAARSDHKHTLTAPGVAGASAPGDTAAAGTGTAPARSDHRHSREAFAGTADLADVAAAEAAGTAASVPRGDHTHAHGSGYLPDAHHAKSHIHDGVDGSGTVAHSATTGRTANDHHNQAHGNADHTTGVAAGASTPGDAAAEGASAAVARADHRHSREAFATTTELADVAAAEGAGASGTVPRGDHVHAHGSGYLPDAHHNRQHDHSNASDGTALTPESVEVTGGPVAFRGDISPTIIGANQNDYNPAGLADAVVLRLTANADVDITGLQGGADGRVLFLIHRGDATSTITLKNESASSTAANRFGFAADVALDIGDGVLLWYDSTNSRWRCVARFDASGGGGSVATDIIWDALGDLAVGSGPDTASRLAKGSDYQSLIVDSAEALDLKWAMRSYVVGANVTEVATGAATAETDLQTVVVPANLLGTTGVIRITAAWTASGATNTKTVRIYWGTTLIGTVSYSAAQQNDGTFEALVFMDGATNAQKILVLVDRRAATFSETNVYLPSTQDTTAAVTVKVTGQTTDAADDVQSEILMVERLQ